MGEARNHHEGLRSFALPLALSMVPLAAATWFECSALWRHLLRWLATLDQPGALLVLVVDDEGNGFSSGFRKGSLPVAR